jgi:hypothetical protein
MQRPGGVVGLFVIAMCVGCSRYTVQSTHDPAVNFQALKTYDWKPGPQLSLGDPRVSDALVNATIRGVVDRELAAKGFTKSSVDSADFLLAYDGGINFERSVVAITRSTNAGADAFVAPQHLNAADFEQGTVVLMVFDPRTERLIWRGIVTGMFDPTATPEQRRQRITDAMHKLLKQFPPQ